MSQKKDKEGTIRMVQNFAMVAMQSIGKILILRDFSYEEIKWNTLDTNEGDNTWGFKFSRMRTTKPFFHQRVSEVTRAWDADLQ